jgi:hypothetical protein
MIECIDHAACQKELRHQMGASAPFDRRRASTIYPFLRGLYIRSRHSLMSGLQPKKRYMVHITYHKDMPPLHLILCALNSIAGSMLGPMCLQMMRPLRVLLIQLPSFFSLFASHDTTLSRFTLISSVFVICRLPSSAAPSTKPASPLQKPSAKSPGQSKMIVPFGGDFRNFVIASCALTCFRLHIQQATQPTPLLSIGQKAASPLRMPERTRAVILVRELPKVASTVNHVQTVRKGSDICMVASARTLWWQIRSSDTLDNGQ